MTTSLPVANQQWPRFRLLTAQKWNGTAASGGGWKIEAMERPGPRSVGFILVDYTRALLPQLGTATIIYRYGLFSDRLVGGSSATNDRMKAGNAYTPGTDSMDIPDLRGKELRIQVAYPDADGNVAASDWKTVWWGNCEYQTDEGWGGAGVPSGERRYDCLDAFARTRRWFMDRHGFRGATLTVAPAAGHPGYNVSRRSSAQLAGNKDSTGSTVSMNNDGVAGRMFSLPGSGDTWTDNEAANEALTNHRPIGEPQWVPGGATDLFDTSSPWPIRDGDTVHDVVCRIYNRARGRGAALPTWTEPSPTGPLTCTLTIFAQLYQNITYDDPAGSQVTVNGAASRSTAVDADLIGDHRLSPGSLRLGDAEQYRVDYLVTQGEPIEVLGTLEYDLTLEKGWSAGEQSTFVGLDKEKRISERWRPVYQLHRLKRNFNMSLGNGNGGGASSADYRCDDRGQIKTTKDDLSVGDSAPSTIVVLDDLPIYDGYQYDVQPPTRDDGQSAASFDGTPPRREPMLLFRDGSNDRYTRHDALPYNVQLRNHPDGFLVFCSEDQATGQRKLGDGNSTLNQDRRYDTMVLTVGFQLPHRVRMATGQPTGARKLIITMPDVHLWLAHPGAIWRLDDSDDTHAPSYAPKRIGGSSHRIIRDDRAALARQHALATSWYMPRVNSSGQTVFKHRSASWALRCCADIPSSLAYDGGGIVYPTLGQVVHLLKANGEFIEVNSVMSSFSYDNTSGTSSFVTDWQDLDIRNG